MTLLCRLQNAGHMSQQSPRSGVREGNIAVSNSQLEMPLAVASYDVDYGGVVSNIAYVRWLEDMRHALIERLYPFQRQMAECIAPAVVDTHIVYRKPLRFLDQPLGRMSASLGGGVRLVFEAQVVLGPATVATARQECVFLHLPTGRPLRVPKEIVSVFDAS